MTTLLLALAVAATAQDAPPKKRLRLVCEQADTIRDLKAAMVEDSGWDHKLADEWARCACPEQADKAGWPEPLPQLPAKWRGAQPSLSPDKHEANVKFVVDFFLLYPKRPLPLDKEQALRIAECWSTKREADMKARQKAAAKKP